MFDYPARILANNGNDYIAAYAVLSNAYHKLANSLNEAQSSRFIEISGDDNGVMSIQKVTEKDISDAVDFEDCYPPPPHRKWFWCGYDGVLYPVTIGKMKRCVDNDSDICATSDIIANGNPVGMVVYTDH